MKNLKRIIMLLLAFSLVFTLFACGGDDGPCKEHTDDDEDGICDVCEECIEHFDEDEDGYCDACEEEMEDESGDGIALVEDGEILFNVVLGSDITSSIRMTVDDIVDTLDELGIELVVTDDKKGDEADIEVLVGTVTSRGKDYEYDKYSLGAEGYVITAIDETKIIITGGSEESLVGAFTKFFEDYLGITEDLEELEDFTFTDKHDVIEIQDNYRIPSITVDGNDLKEYTISRDRADEVTDALALKLQAFFYEKAGYYINVVNPADAGDKTISFKLVDKGKAGATGFRVKLDGDNLIIECAHKTKFEEAFNEYYSTFSRKQEAIELGAYNGKTDITCVYYKDFGAVGDGKTDDYEAIKAAHEEANKNNQTVYGEKGKTYYIGKAAAPIVIQTDTDWRGAKFIFDASAFNPEDSGNVFSIESTYSNVNFYQSGDRTLAAVNALKGEDGLVLRGINHGEEQTTKIDALALGYPAMVKVYNSDAKTYIRWGYVDTAGGSQCEVILIDKDGNIDPSTPFLLDYEKVTQIVAIRTDIPTITVKNATVESKSSRVNLLGGYKSIAHSIEVRRPNTVIENLVHIITGEIPDEAPSRQDPITGLWEDVTDEGFEIINGLVYQNGKKYTGTDVIKPYTGYSYGGFIQVTNTHNTLIKNCTFQSRVHYVEGTYDISCSYANQTVFENCTQSNFFDTREIYTKYGDSTVPNMSLCWGISGTNYCKNLHYLNSELTRYDAHCGVFNGSIVGGKMCVLRLIGGGTFTIDGVDFYARGGAPLQLREDYGSTFNGTLIVKDTNFKYAWYSQYGNYNFDITLIDAPTANVYNGYSTYFPNIVIDGITVETTSTEINLISLCNQSYNPTGEHFPARCLIRDNVSDPDALFDYFYETANPNIVEEQPDKFPFLAGRTKNTKLSATNYKKLTDKEYMVVDNGGGVYTVIATKVKNLQPYNPPEFIEIKNMKDKTNLNGKKFTLTLYKSNFFANTEIRDEDGVLKWITAPNK